MNAKLFLILGAMVAAVSCEICTKPEADNNAKYNAEYTAMQQLIDSGAEYDITNVEQLINGDVDYWQFNRVLNYNKDFKAVTAVVCNYNEENDTPIYRFAATGEVFGYDLNDESGRIVKQSGSWSFEPRTQQLSIVLPAFSGNEALDLQCKLLALSNSAIVLEWVTDEGKALRASLQPASYSEMELVETNNIVAELLEGCKEYDTEALINGIVGAWIENSELVYDSEWNKVVRANYLLGLSYVEGVVYSTYTFTADGNGTQYYEPEEPGLSPQTISLTWSYDNETNKLKLTGEMINAEYVVSGYSNEYLVLDSSDADANVRTILKRKM